MDTTQTTHISLCSGYGGIDLGLRRCIPNLRTVAYSEIETFAVELLLARMEGGQLDAAPIWSDLKSFPWGAFHGKVDILSGGYPCQPFSAAGKRLGADDERHLWLWIADGIRLMRPRLCFFENVEGHVTLGLSTVVSDLEELGYRTTWGIFSASEVGSPHQRRRVFIVAHRIDAGLEGHAWYGKAGNQQRWLAQKQDGSTCQSGVCVWPSQPGEPQYAWEPPRTLESALGRDIDGASSGMDYAELCDNRTDELRLLGNGVVPATAERAFRVLMSEIQNQI